MCIKPLTKAWKPKKLASQTKQKQKDMNHGAKSVVRHMVEGDESRASDFFCQPLNGVEFLLQGQTCISQHMEATEGKRHNLICNST